jgi:hypothetical protein
MSPTHVPQTQQRNAMQAATLNPKPAPQLYLGTNVHREACDTCTDCHHQRLFFLRECDRADTVTIGVPPPLLVVCDLSFTGLQSRQQHLLQKRLLSAPDDCQLQRAPPHGPQLRKASYLDTYLVNGIGTRPPARRRVFILPFLLVVRGLSIALPDPHVDEKLQAQRQYG